MDNGSEIFAKLPNPIAGPAFYTTASEVATREFVSSSATQAKYSKPDFNAISSGTF
jgi:hypothetical protein